MMYGGKKDSEIAPVTFKLPNRHNNHEFFGNKTSRINSNWIKTKFLVQPGKRSNTTAIKQRKNNTKGEKYNVFDHSHDQDIKIKEKKDEDKFYYPFYMKNEKVLLHCQEYQKREKEKREKRLFLD